jgi:hypothetical protein
VALPEGGFSVTDAACDIDLKLLLLVEMETDEDARMLTLP